MAVGNIYLRNVSVEQAETVPGMAHFACGGPFGTTCGDCKYLGYYRKRKLEYDPQTNEWKEKQYKSRGCAKFYELTGSHGPAVARGTKSCKYFEEKLKP